MPLKEELLKLECTTCSDKCKQEHGCRFLHESPDKALCLADAEQVLEALYQHAKEHNWCRYETSGMPHEGVHYPLERKDFELEDK